MAYYLAVFDVGKTNKKLIIYDQDLRWVDAVYQSFPTRREGGLPVEPVDEIVAWLFDQLKTMAAKYALRSISVTTHGACFVCIDAQGRQTVPCMDYTYEPGDAFHDRFYAVAGDKAMLQQQTATLELKALINPAKQIFFLQQQFPDAFAKTTHILFYPQYFAYKLTGRIAADFTYAGCHTYLWDFAAGSWSGVADRLGVRGLLPKTIDRSHAVLGSVSPDVAARTGLATATTVLFGVHDSNASLLPYLIKESSDFILNSTGTWCVAMRPAETVAFAPAEIGKSVFFNLSVFGRPVKTSIMMGGLEFAAYTDIFKRLTPTDDYPDFNRSLYQRVIEQRSLFILPGVVPGSGQFPASLPRIVENDVVYSLPEIAEGRRTPAFFNDFAVAYAVLNLSLAIQSKVALERIGMAPGICVYTEGGFRSNPDYNILVATIFPQSQVFLTNIAEATSFGAAILGKAAVEAVDPATLGNGFSIEKEPIAPVQFAGLDEYIKTYLELVERA